MTIQQLIDQLRQLASDPDSGVTLDSPVRIDSLSGSEDIVTVFAWPALDGAYVSFSSDDPESVAELVAQHREAIAAKQNRGEG